MSQHNIQIYNPANQTRDEFVENFVIRTKEFNLINRSLNDTALDQSPQHFLIEGQRGTGKTSLLLRLQYAMLDEEVSDYLLPVQLPEEQYSIFDLCRLWEHVAEYLDEIPGFHNTSDLLDEHRDDDDYPSICYDLIDALLIENNRRLVLLLDNFGEMLKRIGEVDQKRLRDILHMSKHIQIVAAAAKTLEQTYKYESPFYEFFKKIRLKGLSRADSIILLGKLAESYDRENFIRKIINEEPQRIETIRRLSGGIPRTLILLFEILLDDTAQVFSDLESILDKVTPLYKHRMDDLSKQQQIIVDAIALNWDGISNREIANALKNRSIDGKKIAAQLKELEKNDLVYSKPIDRKNKIYFIAERFFNIWYLMRFGRKKNKDHVKWLVLFLQEWCSPDELKTRAHTHIESLKNKTLHSRGGYLMAEAMALALPDADLGEQLLLSTMEYLGHTESGQAQRFAENSQVSRDRNDVINRDDDPSKSITLLKQRIEKGDREAMYNLANLYRTEYQDFDNATRYYQMAIEKDHAGAMYNLAYLYKNEYQDMDKAIRYYQMAIEKDDVDSMNELSWIYYQTATEKDLALKLSTRARDLNATDEVTHTNATIALWHQKFELSNELITEYLTDLDYSSTIGDITDYFILLLAIDQRHNALKLFNDFPKLKEAIKPVYFATMKLLQDEYPKEYPKMGDELEETVEEVLLKINEYRKKYGNT